MELDAAIVRLVSDNLGATVGEAVRHMLRQFGTRSASAQLRAAITTRYDAHQAAAGNAGGGVMVVEHERRSGPVCRRGEGEAKLQRRSGAARMLVELFDKLAF